MKLFVVSIAFLLLVFSGCSQPEPKSKYERPSWVMKPNQDGKIGAVGSAYIHHRGVSHQRRLAITRALDELSLQRGVDVSMSMAKEEQVTNDRVSTDLNVKSSYTANTKITAHIEEVWQDPMSQEYFVWLVLD